MSLQVSGRAQRVKPSPTLAVRHRRAPKAEGHRRHRPRCRRTRLRHAAHIAQAGIDAINGGFTRYTNVDGTNELKDAIIAKFKRDNGIEYARPQILVSCGAKQTLYNLCMAVLDPGVEAVIPAPYWVSYPDMVLLSDGLPVMPFAGPGAGLQDHPAAARDLDHAQDAHVLLNSPAIPPEPRTRAPNCGRWARCCWNIHVSSSAPMMYEKIFWDPEPSAAC